MKKYITPQLESIIIKEQSIMALENVGSDVDMDMEMDEEA